MSEMPNLLLSSLPRCRKGVAFVVVQYLSSICPVLVQYLSSELLDMYWTTTEANPFLQRGKDERLYVTLRSWTAKFFDLKVQSVSQVLRLGNEKKNEFFFCISLDFT